MNNSSKKSIFSWALYDWANSAFSTIILTFVFSVYFTRSVVGDEVLAGAYWGYAIAAGGLIIAFLAPILGAIADFSGRTRLWIGSLTFYAALATVGLYFISPEASSLQIFMALFLVVFALITIELAIVFCNAQLPLIASKEKIGRISGWGWALGYIGGLTSLIIALICLTGLGESLPPLINLPTENMENVRASAILVAIWMIVFTIPLLIFTPDLPRREISRLKAIKKGLAQLWQSILSIKSYSNLVRFLIASALYRDGLATLFALGGVYAAATYGMEFTDILLFAVGLNVTAGIGAFAFSFMDDKAGSKKTIMLSLIFLILTGIAILFAPDKTTFILIALVLGLFVGPVQAASRTMAGRLAPENMTAQIYGLYAFTGKSIAFLGPLSYGLFTQIWDTQKAGLISIILFWVAGLILLNFVKEKHD